MVPSKVVPDFVQVTFSTLDTLIASMIVQGKSDVSVFKVKKQGSTEYRFPSIQVLST